MIAHRNLLKDIGRVLFWFPLRWCVNLMPFLVVYWIGGILGCIDYLFSGPKRIKKMVKNISQVFELNEKEAKRTIVNNLQNHCRNVLELTKYTKLNKENIANFLSFEGLEILDRELAKGKGVILATSHFGAKQLLQVGLGLCGYKINQISYHLKGGELSFIQKCVSQKQRKKIEDKIPAKFISAKDFLRPAYDCLKENQILIIAADGVGLVKYMGKEYAPYSFLGKEMLLPKNVASLAKRTGASMVPAFVVREGEKHRIIVEPALSVNEQPTEEIFEQFVRVLEKYIRQYPSLWEFWEEFEEGNLLVASHK